MLIRLFATLALALVLSPQGLRADQHYANTCDPDQEDPQVCNILAQFYEKGQSPFPIDPDRAKQLKDAVQAHQQTACLRGETFYCARWLFALEARVAPSTAADLQATFDQIAGAMERACNAENPRACVHRSGLYHDAQHLILALSLAEQLGKDAQALRTAKAGDPALWEARVTPAAQARFALEDAKCTAGDMQACGEAGILLPVFLKPSKEDHGQIARLYPACLAIGGTSCRQLRTALMFLSSGAEPAKALVGQTLGRLEADCARGNGNACAARAAEFAHKERAKRRPFWVKACAADHAKSCERLANAAYRAYAKAPDPAMLLQATEHFDKACDLGDTLSCHTLEHLSKG